MNPGLGTPEFLALALIGPVEFSQGNRKRRCPMLVLYEGNLRLLVRVVEDGGEEGVARSDGGGELIDEAGDEILALCFAGTVGCGGVECLHEHCASADFEAPLCLCCCTFCVETACLVEDVDLEGLEREETDEGFAGAETDCSGDDFLEFGRGKGPLGYFEGEAFPWDGGGLEGDGGGESERGWCDEGGGCGFLWRGGCLYCDVGVGVGGGVGGEGEGEGEVKGSG